MFLVKELIWTKNLCRDKKNIAKGFTLNYQNELDSELTVIKCNKYDEMYITSPKNKKFTVCELFNYYKNEETNYKKSGNLVFEYP